MYFCFGSIYPVSGLSDASGRLCNWSSLLPSALQCFHGTNALHPTLCEHPTQPMSFGEHTSVSLGCVCRTCFSVLQCGPVFRSNGHCPAASQDRQLLCRRDLYFHPLCCWQAPLAAVCILAIVRVVSVCVLQICEELIVRHRAILPAFLVFFRCSVRADLAFSVLILNTTSFSHTIFIYKSLICNFKKTQWNINWIS